MRGKEIESVLNPFFSGITPAYAGKSLFYDFLKFSFADHPRVCGEKSHLARAFVYIVGSPPRMRGKVPALYDDYDDMRITPAYAGKRTTAQYGIYILQDHPRVCGEK